MKKLIKYFTISFFLTMSFFMANAQSMTVTFTTTQITSGTYSPANILAVWVKKSTGQYVRTLMVYASERKSYLYKWNSNSGGDKTDAVTGATLSTQKTFTVTWNMKNYAATTVANGSYLLCMEMTSSDAQGPYREISFTINGNDMTLSPADGSNFTNISLVYENGVASVQQTDLQQNFVKPYPQVVENSLRADVNILKAGKSTFTIYNNQDQKIGSRSLELNQGSSTVDLSDLIMGIPAGIYFIITETNGYVVSNKFIKK
jgi:hypothetical protein